MKSIFLLALAAQLPFVANSASPFHVAAPPTATPAAIASGVAAPSEALSSANVERLRQLLANTKSVMKRRDTAATIDSAATRDAAPSSDGARQGPGTSETGSRDDQILQAAYLQLQKQSPAGDGSNNAGQGATGAGNSQAGQGTAGGVQGSGNQPDSAAEAPANGSAAGTGAAVDSAMRAAANASTMLLASALAAPAENALDGRPVPLAEALGGRVPAGQRLEVAALYWKLALAMADYHWAVDEARQLDALPANPGAIDSPLLATARAAAQAQMLEAKAAAVTVQQELADAILQPTQPPPITVEQPLVGPYRTEFDTIFANRAAPGRSRAIHRGLPLLRAAIDLRTAAVQAATSAVETTEAAYGEKSAGIETLLYAHRELHQQRRSFLNAVREYNAEIVEYASYVAGPTTSTATLVGMLTRSKPSKLSLDGDANPFIGANEPTPADPRNDPNVRQASGELEVPDRGWQSGGRGFGPESGTGTETPGGAGTSGGARTELRKIDE